MKERNQKAKRLDIKGGAINCDNILLVNRNKEVGYITHVSLFFFNSQRLKI